MEQNPASMEEGQRRTMRADAERNRRRLLDAATEMFCERGLDVGVGEIAQQAGVGRGTLFRNFPSKEHLIAAIVVERMRESINRGHAALEAPDPGEALFDLIEQSVGRSQTDRALFDAIARDVAGQRRDPGGPRRAHRRARRAGPQGPGRRRGPHRHQRRRRADDGQGRLRGGRLLPARQARRDAAPARPRPRRDQRPGSAAPAPRRAAVAQDLEDAKAPQPAAAPRRAATG